MTLLTNLLAYSGQLLVLVAIGAAVPTLLRITAPAVRHAYWRALLAFALLLPWLQGRSPSPVSASTDIEFLSAAASSAHAATGDASWNWTTIALTIFAAGVAARLVTLATGLARLRALRRAGHPAPALELHEDIQQALCTRAEIRYVDGLGQPVTFGFVRPVVLLPAALRAQPPDIERAVLCHELLHVQRRDWMWLLIEEAIRTAFWFHPAMWLLISRVQQSREEVVDEMAVMATGSRRIYIEALAQFAGASGNEPAPAFSQRRHLFRRILLLSRSRVMSSQRVTFACAVIAMMLVTGWWSASAAFPLAAAPAAPRPASDVALTAAAPQVSSITIARPVSPRQAETAPGPRPAPVRRAEAVVPPPSTSLEDTLPIVVATTVPDTARPDARDAREPLDEAADPPRALRVGGAIGVPAKTRHVAPVYPAIAQAARVSGIVILEATVSADGRVDSARVLRSIPLLDQAALDAVYQWEFRPTYLNGSPVPIVLSLTVNFVAEG